MDQTSGEIQANSIYRLDELQRRLGVSRTAWRSLLRAGLPLIELPKVRRKFASGRQVIEFMERFAPSEN